MSGGYGTLRTTELLDISGSSTPSSLDLPGDRCLHSSHYLPLSGSLLVCGGACGGASSSCISTTNPVTGPWSSHSTTVKERRDHSGAVVNNTVYLVAGYPGSSRQTTEILDEATGTWSLGPQLPHNLAHGSCSTPSSETMIIISGGNNGLNKVTELDTTTGVYTSLANMPRQRRYHGCTVFTAEGGKRYLVVAGGESSSRLKDSDVLDISANTWHTGGDMSQARKYAQVVRVNNRVVILG